jgi:hypothetical protein
MATLLNNLLGNFLLAPHGINGDNRFRNIQLCQ